VCDKPTADHRNSLLWLTLPHDDPDLMMMRRVCRRCAPDEARARVIAAGLLPYVTGGAA
jgi:hypothetical protein